MTTFKNLESLKQFLRQDAKQVSLNPVRFINVDSMAMWIEAKKFCSLWPMRRFPFQILRRKGYNS